ncbi:MAG TPA: hypothetical protein VIR60_08800 [Gammaproteobacteria bacterium]
MTVGWVSAANPNIAHWHTLLGFGKQRLIPTYGPVDDIDAELHDRVTAPVSPADE